MIYFQIKSGAFKPRSCPEGGFIPPLQWSWSSSVCFPCVPSSPVSPGVPCLSLPGSTLSTHLVIISNQHTCLPSSNQPCPQELWTNCQSSLAHSWTHTLFLCDVSCSESASFCTTLAWPSLRLTPMFPVSEWFACLSHHPPNLHLDSFCLTSACHISLFLSVFWTKDLFHLTSLSTVCV